MTSRKEFANLDLLRAAAVLCVVVSHIPEFALGHLRGISGDSVLTALGKTGVLLFFIHTSLVLMMSLERLHREGGDVIWRFYVRRFFRIYPLSTVVILFVVAFPMPVGVQRGWPGWGNLWENLLLVQNLRLMPRVVLAPLWSLPYEVQMYLILPLLYRAVRQARAYWQVAMLCTAAMLAQQACAVVLERGAGLGHLFMATPWFLLGVCAFGVLRSRRFRIAAWVYAPALVGFCVALALLRHAGRFSWWAGCAFAFLLPHFQDIEEKSLLRRAAHLLARYSYGIYLAQVPILWFAFDKLAARPAIFRVAVCAVLLLGVPAALYHLIEEPMIRLGARFASTRAHRRPSTVSPTISRVGDRPLTRPMVRCLANAELADRNNVGAT